MNTKNQINDSVVGCFIDNNKSFLYTAEFSVYRTIETIEVDKIECYPTPNQKSLRNDLNSVLIDRGFEGFKIEYFDE